MRITATPHVVTRLDAWTRASVLLRSFAIQGSWNYRTLIGGGFGFALLPALRRIYADQPERLDDAVERHTQLFNSHPYLAPMALGAVAAMEASGEGPQVVDRFKTAVRGSLGTLGDRLVWAGWRPVCLLFALALLLAGAAWWVGVVAFLMVYNAGHLLLRLWVYRLGLREGKSVGERLRHSPLGDVQRALPVVGAFLVGLMVPAAAAGRHLLAGVAEDRPGGAWIVAAAAAVVLGVRFGGRIRAPVVILLIAFAFLGTLVRILS
jgi:PTS system mannose-specific IID component